MNVSRFDRLYRDNFPFVWAAAHRCGAPRDAVDDVVQDVFVTAFRRLDELRWEVSPRGWLYGVTRKVAYRYRRTAARTGRKNAAVATVTRSADNPHRQLDAADAVAAVLNQLDATQRETFVMTELLGMSGPEIAAELSVPLNTVYSRLRLARKRMTALIGSEDGLAAAVATTQQADRPTRRDEQRTSAALMPLIGSAWGPAKAATLGALKAAWVPAITLSIAVGSYVVTTSRNPPPVDVATGTLEAKQARAQPAGPYQPKSVAEPAADVQPEVARVESPAPADAAVGIAAATIAAPVPSSPTVPSPAPPDAPAPSQPQAATAPAPAGTLAEEIALLDAAKASLDGGDPDRAIAALDEHALRFARGQLTQARQATRVRALCKAGRTAEAESIALALHRDNPNSNLVRRTPKKCATT